MSETNQNSSKLKNEICIIKVAMPVTSDEKAFELKRGIDNLVGGIENAHVEFTVKTVYGQTAQPPLPAGFIPPKTSEG